MNDHVLDDYVRAKKLYELICNREFGGDSSSVQQRLDVIGQLESLSGKEFRNTSEFHLDVRAYIDNGGERLKSVGKRLRKARKSRGWTLKRLAGELGFRSHSAFIMYEQDKRIPPKMVLEWLLQEEKKAAQDALGRKNVSAPSTCSEE